MFFLVFNLCFVVFLFYFVSFCFLIFIYVLLSFLLGQMSNLLKIFISLTFFLTWKVQNNLRLFCFNLQKDSVYLNLKISRKILLQNFHPGSPVLKGLLPCVTAEYGIILYLPFLFCGTSSTSRDENFSGNFFSEQQYLLNYVG